MVNKRLRNAILHWHPEWKSVQDKDMDLQCKSESTTFSDQDTQCTQCQRNSQPQFNDIRITDKFVEQDHSERQRIIHSHLDWVDSDRYPII